MLTRRNNNYLSSCKRFYMKKAILFLVSIFITIVSFAQNNPVYKMYRTQNYHNQLRLNTKTGEVLQIQDDGQSWTICTAREVLGDKEGRFCLYDTQNIWTFIMLDTYTGKNWQVQFSVKGEDYRFATPINMFSLAYPKTTSNWTSRFQMFKTQNIWNFILLDSYNGRLWQFQYSTQDFDEKMIIPINRYELVSDNERCIFSIQPLTSMFQYYLINDSTGDMWKFQWSTKGDDYRWIEKFK